MALSDGWREYRDIEKYRELRLAETVDDSEIFAPGLRMLIGELCGF